MTIIATEAAAIKRTPNLKRAQPTTKYADNHDVVVLAAPIT